MKYKTIEELTPAVRRWMDSDDPCPSSELAQALGCSTNAVQIAAARIRASKKE